MASQSTHRIRRTSMTRSVWCRPQKSVSNGLWIYHAHWPDDRFGLQNQPGKNTRERQIPHMPATNAQWMAPQGPINIKKLPVESDVPKFLVDKSRHCLATALDHTVADLTTIAFYYLLRIGEYTVKGTKNKMKRTVQFKMEDVTSFKKDKCGCIMCLSRNAPLADILSADEATLKLDSQKNGHKGVCVYQQTTSDPIHCPVCMLG
jgi:hypothetical protein